MMTWRRRRQTITWNNFDKYPWRHLTSLSHNDSTQNPVDVLLRCRVGYSTRWPWWNQVICMAGVTMVMGNNWMCWAMRRMLLDWTSGRGCEYCAWMDNRPLYHSLVVRNYAQPPSPGLLSWCPKSNHCTSFELAVPLLFLLFVWWYVTPAAITGTTVLVTIFKWVVQWNLSVTTTSIMKFISHDLFINVF